MKVDVLLGLQWGDEGKGKVVDVLTPNYDVVTRFQGGPNAGHTLEFNGEKYVLRSIPSGIFQGGKINVIGNGVVLDPLLFKQEAESLAASGHDITKQLYISKKAHLILPTHRILDAAYEAAKGSGKIGTTGKGIGPTYTDKISRNGVRVGDLLHNFEEKYAAAKAKHEAILRSLNYEYDITEMEAQWMEALNYLKQFKLIDSEHVINNYLKEGKSVLAEGAQGTMLDIDFGSYPFVTSSNTICAGCCTGLGVSPRNIGEVYGIFKAYCTRVGSGPFPTELFDEVGDKIGQLGHEFGAVTGRKRRCGWIDLVALKYAVMINGVSQLIMMKSDVLDTFDTIKACVAYKMNGVETNEFPYEIDDTIEPVYVELPGWKTDMTKMQSEDEFPEEFNAYLSFLEEELGVQLFARVKRGVSLTDNGARLIPYIQEMVNQKDKLRQAAFNINNKIEGKLRVGSFSSITALWMPDVVHFFRENYPKVDVEIFDGNYDEIRDWIIHGQVDCGFLSSIVADDLTFYPLLNDPLCAVFPEGHPLAAKNSVTLPELFEYPLIIETPGCDNDIQHLLTKCPVRPKISYSFRDDTLIMSFVRNGLGVTISQELVLKAFARGVVSRPLSPSCHRTLGLAFSKTANSVVSQTMLRYLQETIH